MCFPISAARRAYSDLLKSRGESGSSALVSDKENAKRPLVSPSWWCQAEATGRRLAAASGDHLQPINLLLIDVGPSLRAAQQLN